MKKEYVSPDVRVLGMISGNLMAVSGQLSVTTENYTEEDLDW